MTLHIVDFNISAPNPNSLAVAQGGTSNASTFQVTAFGIVFGDGHVQLPERAAVGRGLRVLAVEFGESYVGRPVTVTLTVTAGSGNAVGGPTTVTLAANVAGAPAAKTQTFTLTVTGSDRGFCIGGDGCAWL